MHICSYFFFSFLLSPNSYYSFQYRIIIREGFAIGINVKGLQCSRERGGGEVKVDSQRNDTKDHRVT